MLVPGRAFFFHGRVAPIVASLAGMSLAGADGAACHGGNSPPAAASAGVPAVSAVAQAPSAQASSDDAASGPDGGVEITLQDDGRAFDIARGATITIALPRRAGTGYSWKAALDNAVLAEEGGAATVDPGDASSEPPGSPRLDVHRFVAIAPGTAEVTMSLARAFGAAAPVRTMHVTVHVR